MSISPLGKLYARECERQAERYAAERARTQAKTVLGTALVGASDRLAGQEDGPLTDYENLIQPTRKQ